MPENTEKTDVGAIIAAAAGNPQLTAFITELGALALAKAIEFFNIGRMSPEAGLAWNNQMLDDLDAKIKASRERIAAEENPPTSES